MTNVIKLIWKLDILLLLPLTYRPYNGCYAPRSITKRIKLGSWRLIDHPWLWCDCGDSMETWQEVKQGKCMICSDLGE